MGSCPFYHDPCAASSRPAVLQIAPIFLAFTIIAFTFSPCRPVYGARHLHLGVLEVVRVERPPALGIGSGGC